MTEVKPNRTALCNNCFFRKLPFIRTNICKLVCFFTRKKHKRARNWETMNIFQSRVDTRKYTNTCSIDSCRRFKQLKNRRTIFY